MVNGNGWSERGRVNFVLPGFAICSHAPVPMARPSLAPSVEDLVRDACRGAAGPLRELLLRRGGLPGPRPNLKLAEATAQALVSGGDEGRRLIEEMRAMGDNEAPAGSAFPIFPMVGVLGLGVVAARAQDEDHLKVALRALHDHADDGRREVRDAVVAALGLALKAQPLRTLEGLEGWSDGYFHAELMLQALSDPSMTQHLQDVRLPLVRVQEAFALAAGAPRAHQRTHGYRALLRTMSGAIATLGTRFPHPVAQWVEEHAQVATKDLLAVLNTSLDQLSSGGLRRGDAQSMHEALDAAVPPPRDPRWDVGPTRGRGKKARRKGRQG